MHYLIKFLLLPYLDRLKVFHVSSHCFEFSAKTIIKAQLGVCTHAHVCVCARARAIIGNPQYMCVQGQHILPGSLRAPN